MKYYFNEIIKLQFDRHIILALILIINQITRTEFKIVL